MRGCHPILTHCTIRHGTTALLPLISLFQCPPDFAWEAANLAHLLLACGQLSTQSQQNIFQDLIPANTKSWLKFRMSYLQRSGLLSLRLVSPPPSLPGPRLCKIVKPALLGPPPPCGVALWSFRHEVKIHPERFHFSSSNCPSHTLNF